MFSFVANQVYLKQHLKPQCYSHYFFLQKKADIFQYLAKSQGRGESWLGNGKNTPIFFEKMPTSIMHFQ